MKQIFLAIILVTTTANIAMARTWGIADYDRDPNSSYEEFEFEALEFVKNYEDPLPTEVDGLASPLEDFRYISYDIIVKVNLKDTQKNYGQRMRVYKRGEGLIYYWKVSTARKGKHTPRGYFTPQLFSSEHQSSLYNNAHMPWAVFFNGNIAMHAILNSNKIARLGRVASAGCVRMEPQRAEILFHMIGQSGEALVEEIDVNGNKVYQDNGLPNFVEKYKTLIIIE